MGIIQAYNNRRPSSRAARAEPMAGQTGRSRDYLPVVRPETLSVTIVALCRRLTKGYNNVSIFHSERLM